MKWTISDIRYANKEAGYFFFSREAMRFWNSRVDRQVYQGVGGVYFVTYDSAFGQSRYSVRRFEPGTAQVFTVAGTGGHLPSLQMARDVAKALAQGNEIRLECGLAARDQAEQAEQAR